jgi:hypothetical protein
LLAETSWSHHDAIRSARSDDHLNSRASAPCAAPKAVQVGRAQRSGQPHQKGTVMHKFGVAAALGGLLAIGGLPLTGGASRAATGTSPGQGVREVITLFSPTTQFKLVDLGDPGFSLGDQDVFTDDLLTKRRGKTVGFDGGVCSVVRVADASTQSGTLQCLVTYSLKQGQITTQGLVRVANGALEGTQIAAVTGGTRRFRNATGESAVTFLTPTEANVTLSIRR